MSNGEDRAFGELTAEVRALRQMFEQHNAEEVRWREKVDTRFAEYSRRLRFLERWRDVLVGAGIFAGVVWGALKSFIVWGPQR